MRRPNGAHAIWRGPPNNAERCAEYGFGVVVEPATVTATELGDACRRVLNDPAFRIRVRQAQRSFLAMPDALAAADDIARITVDQLPYGERK